MRAYLLSKSISELNTRMNQVMNYLCDDGIGTSFLSFHLPTMPSPHVNLASTGMV
jgi:hypothetical protein